MTRNKPRAIFKNLLTRDIIYIINKSICMDAIRSKKYKLVSIEGNGYWYSGTSYWSMW